MSIMIISVVSVVITFCGVFVWYIGYGAKDEKEKRVLLEQTNRHLTASVKQWQKDLLNVYISKNQEISKLREELAQAKILAKQTKASNQQIQDTPTDDQPTLDHCTFQAHQNRTNGQKPMLKTWSIQQETKLEDIPAEDYIDLK
jgi:hypothetical protein